MNKAKRFISLVLCILLCTVLCSAVSAEEATPKITITSLEAMPEDTVTLDISIENNPGIMGMAFSVAYDSDAFEYVSYENGWLSGMTVKDHPDKGCVIFVYVATSNKTNTGKMLSVSFKIKETAAPGNHKITLGNNNYEKYGTQLHNSFSNANQEFIVPTVSGGIVTVGETCTNAGHKYGEWNVTKTADCFETGLKNHTCTRDASLCIASERYEEVEIPITHDFEDEWTVDEAATPEQDGVMTRHCKICDATTDRITFTYQEVEDSKNPDDNIDDTSSSDNSTSSGDSSSSTPPINNNVGDKNNLDAVENLKDYQENIKPSLDDVQDDTADSSTDSDSDADSETDVSADVDDGTESEKKSDDSKEDTPFLKTPLGILTIIIAAALVLGIIAIIIILALKNKNR